MNDQTSAPGPAQQDRPEDRPRAGRAGKDQPHGPGDLPGPDPQGSHRHRAEPHVPDRSLSHGPGAESTDPSAVVTQCRVRLARVVEPSDLAGLLLLDALGPEVLWRAITELTVPSPALVALYRKAAQQQLAGSRVPELAQRFAVWRSRLPVPDPDDDARHAALIGAWTVIPEDPDWPAQLDDLGLHRPIVLWGRGERSSLADLGHSVAVVGSRNASAYGAAVTREIAQRLCEAGCCVVSGGAYGIDAIAHESALQWGGEHTSTVAVLACGVDRFYPLANAHLLTRICERGAVLSEVPLGCAPTRYRFLQRNRIIAALSRATVVTEAAWRSGALNTARHAAGLSREVAAVPGDVLVGASAGCHRLIREDHAVLVSGGSEVLELVGSLGNTAAEEQSDALRATDRRPQDGLDPVQLRVFDALPLHSDADPSHLCRMVGLSPGEVLAALAQLRELGLAVDSLLGWRRAPTDRSRRRPGRNLPGSPG